MSSITAPTLEGIQTPLTVNLRTGDPEAKREEIRQYFHQTFDIYETLFEPLKGQQAYVTRADPLRHPLIFYYGHTAVFFINKLVLGKFITKRLDPALERQCAVGVDEMSWDDLNSAHYTWPTFEAVKAYRDKARAVIDELIRTAPLELPISWDSPFWVVMMGIEHERIHLETSSVLIRHLPLELLESEHPAWQTCEADHTPPENQLIDVAAAQLTLGRRQDSPFYGWDNEYGQYSADVAAFKASQYLVSNAEFKAFVDANGYETESYWSKEGWEWARYENRGMPRFWRKDTDGSYRLRVMLKEIPMPWSWPAEVNYLEAKAFCNWKAETTGKPIRLPSEPEWYQLCQSAGVQDVDKWDKAPGNINLAVAASPVPVTAFGFGNGFHDVVGNVWQHTETPIAAYPGFEVHPLYDDFSTPTFDMKHNIIKGGSWISTGNEATLESRYAFRRHFYQHAGFRYVESDQTIQIPDDRFETDPDVVPYCEAHYGADYGGVPNFAEKLAQFCLDLMADAPRGRAMDLGCKVGRTTFELAAGFESVVGIDPTARMLRIGVEMVDKGYTQWEIPNEGDIVDFRQAHLSAFGLDDYRGKIEFLQADLANMTERHNGFDLILINGLLERSYDPAKFLESVHERLNPGGRLVIACCNDWNEAHTKREQWLGGFKDVTGENQRTLDGLTQQLSAHFNRDTEPVILQQVLREHAKKHTLLSYEISVWKRR